MSVMLDERLSTIGENIDLLLSRIDDERRLVLKRKSNSLDLTQYKRQRWTKEAWDAHDRYTMLTNKSNSAHAKFKAEKRKHSKSPTLQEQCKLAEVGLDCGWFALYAAQARTHSMETYKRAYAASTIQDHIGYAAKFLNMSESATTDVQNQYNAILESLSNPPRIYMAPWATSLDQFIFRSAPLTGTSDDTVNASSIKTPIYTVPALRGRIRKKTLNCRQRLSPGGFATLFEQTGFYKPVCLC